MKSTYSLFIASIVFAIVVWSCGPKIPNTKEHNNYKVETIQGENIELRDQLRGKRYRVRDRHKDRRIFHKS